MGCAGIVSEHSWGDLIRSQGFGLKTLMMSFSVGVIGDGVGWGIEGKCLQWFHSMNAAGCVCVWGANITMNVLMLRTVWDPAKRGATKQHFQRQKQKSAECVWSGKPKVHFFYKMAPSPMECIYRTRLGEGPFKSSLICNLIVFSNKMFAATSSF